MKKLLFFLVPIFFFTCKKDNVSGETDAKRLRKIIFSTSISYTFNYDNQNRLINKTDTGIVTAYKSYTNIFYNNQGKISGYIYGDNLIGDHYSYSFIYSNGKIVGKIGTPINSNTHPETHAYAYDTEGQLLTDTAYFIQIPSVVYYKFLYTNKNITEIIFSNSATGQLQVSKNSYDSNPTPFSILGPDLYFVFEDFSSLNSNNCIQSIDPANSNNNSAVSIEYYSNRMPKKAMFSLQGNPHLSCEYFYD